MRLFVMMKKLFIVLFIALTVFAKSPKINGFFIQPLLGYGIPEYMQNFQTQEYFDDWVKSMSDIGAEMLFYQWTAHYESDVNWYHGAVAADFCYYEPNLKEIGGIPVNSWMRGVKDWTGEDVSPIQRVLDAGEKHGVDIWLGLYLNEKDKYNWWDAVNNNEISSSDSATLRYHVERSVDLLKDLSKQFGKHPAFGGFYYPVEIANLGFEEKENWDLLAWLLDSVAVETHKLGDKKLAISPFFNTELTPADEWGEMWDYVLSKSAIDIIMLQDGVGVEPHTIDKIAPFYEAVRNACDKNNKSFWANSELFTNKSGDRGTMDAEPTRIETLLQQMQIEAEYADTFVCFSYMSLDPFVELLSPDGSNAAMNLSYSLEKRTELYNDYKKYYETIKDELPDDDKPEAIAERNNPNIYEQMISVTGNKITLPSFNKPTPYSLINPSGKVILSGVAEKKTQISAPAAAGIYILMLGIKEAAPVRQKLFLQRDIGSTTNYQLRDYNDKIPPR